MRVPDLVAIYGGGGEKTDCQKYRSDSFLHGSLLVFSWSVKASVVGEYQEVVSVGGMTDREHNLRL